MATQEPMAAVHMYSEKHHILSALMMQVQSGNFPFKPMPEAQAVYMVLDQPTEIVRSNPLLQEHLVDSEK